MIYEPIIDHLSIEYEERQSSAIRDFHQEHEDIMINSKRQLEDSLQDARRHCSEEMRHIAECHTSQLVERDQAAQRIASERKQEAAKVGLAAYQQKIERGLGPIIAPMVGIGIAKQRREDR